MGISPLTWIAPAGLPFVIVHGNDNMAELVYILKDMNTLTPEMHSESGFAELFKAVEHKLAE